MQDQYNLMQREEEREMFGLLADQGVGSIPYTPLAKGRLARPWGEHTQRFDVDPVGRRFDIDSDQPIVDAVQKIAETRGVSDGAGRACLGAEEPGRHRSHRRTHKTPSPL
jgi:1-deoxyxylulose-5-phosphate synthase